MLWHCWLGHLTRKTPSLIWYNVFGGALNLNQSIWAFITGMRPVMQQQPINSAIPQPPWRQSQCTLVTNFSEMETLRWVIDDSTNFRDPFFRARVSGRLLFSHLGGATYTIFVKDRPIICSPNARFRIYTVFQKKWRQNSNHYNHDTSYQN